MSQSKRNARAASTKSAGLSKHPALSGQEVSPLLAYRLGSSAPLRLPDEINTPSAATVLRSEYTLGSDAAGNLAFAEAYCPVSAKMVWTVTAGALGAAAASTQHPQHAAFAAEARVARMVALRVTVLYIGAEQTSAGYLSFSEKTSAADINSMTIDALHTGADAQVRATDGMVVYIDYVQPPRYEDPTTGTFMYPTFPFGLFVASGLPASTTSLFRVKAERFMEYLPIEGALSEGELMHEPTDPGILAVHGQLSGPGTSVLAGGKSSEFYARVRAVANAAYHMAAPITPYVVGKARKFLVGNYGKAGVGLMDAALMLAL